MKNSTKFSLFIFAVALIAYGIYKWKVHPAAVTANLEQTQSDEAVDDQQSHVEPTPPVEVPPGAASATAPAADAVNEALIQQKFAAGLKELGTCFGLTGEISERVEPTFQNLNNFIHTDMGDMISSSDRWTNTDIQTPNGENRRIRLEMESGADESVDKRLKYFTIAANGQLSVIPLSVEQTNNPTDTFIATLESDGKVFSRARSVTAYYPNFAEVGYSEKDGHLVSLEMLMGESGKFTCSNMDNNNIACKCHNH